MKKILLCLLLFLLPVTALADQSLVLTFVGDCTIGNEDRFRIIDADYSFDAYLERYGYRYFFGRVQNILRNDDLTIINLESVLQDHGSGAVEKTYNFRGPTHYVNVMTTSSIEAVNIANNHSMDYGYDGVARTIKTLDEAKLPWFGSNNATQKAWIYEKGNIRIGFTGMETTFWSYGHRTLLKEQIESLKAAGCQVVVAVMHGGEEYHPHKQPAQTKFADAAMEYGADLVIGHHPHVLQGIAVKNGKTVCYSLGNFVFGGNPKIRAPYTALFQFTLSFTDDGKYLGHQLNIIPALPSGERDFNNYQPVLATGKDAEKVMAQIQYDSAIKLNPYVEGVGAIQDFVPAPDQSEK